MTPDQIKATFDERASAAAELRSLYESADTEARDLSAEEQVKAARLNTTIDHLDARMKNGLADLQAQRVAEEAATIEASKRSEDAPPSDLQILRELADRRNERRDHVFLPGAEERGTAILVKGTPGVGGYTVPTSFYNQLVEYMVDVSTVVAAGATVLNTTSGEQIQVPVVTAYPTASIVGENVQLTNADVTFVQKPLDAYKYGFTMKVSSELAADTGVNLSEMLARRGGEALGNGIGTAFMTGTGSSQPQGIAPSSGSGGLNTKASKTGSVANGFAYGDLVDVTYDLARPYRKGAVFIVADTIAADIRGLKDSSLRPLWEPSIQLGEPDRLLGYPFLTDPAVPSAKTAGKVGLIFANLKEAVIVRIAGGVRVETSADFAFDTDLTTWRFIVRADSEVVNPTAGRGLTFTT